LTAGSLLSVRYLAVDITVYSRWACCYTVFHKHPAYF